MTTDNVNYAMIVELCS